MGFSYQITKIDSNISVNKYVLMTAPSVIIECHTEEGQYVYSLRSSHFFSLSF